MIKYYFRAYYFNGDEVEFRFDSEEEGKANYLLTMITKYNSIVSDDNKLVNTTNDKLKSIRFLYTMKER